jgi:hypothetical protein
MRAPARIAGALRSFEPTVRAGRGFNARDLRIQMKTPPRGWRFHLMVEAGGIEPQSELR